MRPILRMRPGFTLIELLVVIAIIAILAAILFPVFAAARDRAKVALCTSNLHQLFLGATMYQNDNSDKGLPASSSYQGTWHKQILGMYVFKKYLKNYKVLTCPNAVVAGDDSTYYVYDYYDVGSNTPSGQSGSYHMWIHNYSYPTWKTTIDGIADVTYGRLDVNVDDPALPANNKAAWSQACIDANKKIGGPWAGCFGHVMRGASADPKSKKIGELLICLKGNAVFRASQGYTWW